MFNDDAGFELVNLQAQRDLNSLVKNDETRTVNRDRTTTIDKDETVTVHGNRTETVHKSEHVRIKGNRDKTVNGNDSLIVNKDRKETINKSRSLNVDKTNTEFVKLGKSVTVGLGYATQVGTIMDTAVGIMQTEQVGRIKKTFVGKSYSITAGDEFKITVGKSSLVMNADGSIIITGSSIITQAEGENKVIGKDVLINPPGASAGGAREELEPDYLNDAPAQVGADGLPVQGSDSDEMTDEELHALNDQMIEEAIADGGMVAGSKYGNLQTEQFMNRQAGNINSSVMNNNGSIHSGSMPAYQQQQNQKTFNAAVTVVGVAAGGGSATILYKGSRLVVSKRALDLAKQGKQSVSTLIKNAQKAVPNTTSVPKAMAGGAGGSAAFDFGSQKLLSPDVPYDPRKTAVSAGIGALGGAGGSTIANAAKVPYATLLNIPRTIKNSTSMKILKQQKAVETVGKTAGKAAIDESDNE